MTDDPLHSIQRLQFTNKQQAEVLLLDVIRQTFPLDAVAVELRPLAVSLNSFNGFVELRDGTRLFFKSHTESDTVIREYYNAEMLARAGYPVIQPLYRSTEVGQQILIYEVIDDPSVFDLAWSIEQGDDSYFSALTAAQHKGDAALYRLYTMTLEKQSAEEAAQAPVHQLFYHRIAGGRLERFYGSLPGQKSSDTQIDLPHGRVAMREVRGKQWVINGQVYNITLDGLIEDALQYLKPAQPGPAVVGHGDAHNGNVFFQQPQAIPELIYFDPAFAGRHHPLLDLAKPFFHNVFAMWMYFPIDKQRTTQITLVENGDTWHIDYDYHLPPVRHMFLDSKIENTLIPILQHLKAQSNLRADWRRYFKLALFCCPLLTMDLTDGAKFPPEISLLGLTMAVEMGGESTGERSLIDHKLDRVAEALTG